MNSVALLFAPNDAEAEVTSLERGGVRNGEIMATLGKVREAAGMRLGWRA